MRRFREKLRSRWQTSLTAKIAISFIGFAVAMALLYGIGAYTAIYHTLRVNEEITAGKRAELAGQQMENALATINSTVENLAANTIVVNALVDAYGRESYLIPFLKSSRLPLDVPHRLSLCDFKGEVIASSEAGLAKYAEEPMLKELIGSGRPVARLMGNNGSVLLICYPVIYPAIGTSEGFLALEFPLEPLFFRAGVSLDSVETGLNLLSGDTSVWGLGNIGSHRLSRKLLLPPPLSSLKFSLVLWSTGSRVLIWFTGIFVMVTLLSLYLACRFAYRISGQLTSSLVSLEATASEIAESGTPQGDVVTEGTDEVGRLASSFNLMVRRLKESYGILERKVEERTRELAKLNRELEHMVAERTRELAMSNSDLAGFCYAISHELRAPVARLQGFSEALKDTDQSEESRRFCIERLQVASRQLQTVIDAILLLSRLSQMEMKVCEVDISTLAEEVVRDLRANGVGMGATVTIQQDISCRGDRSLLRVCLMNLIGNAFKYSSREDAPHVEVGISNDDTGSCYYVRDNGAGFDMQYIDKLFVPFQRLHQQEEFPGTGIGLATVQRIIERHNGRVWAEGNEGVGATFFFTLGES